MQQYCNPPPGCCKMNTTSFKYKCDCTVQAGAGVPNTSPKPTPARPLCRWLQRGFGLLMEAISRQATSCAMVASRNTGDDEFACGQDIGMAGDALDTSAEGIGGALVNCGFGHVLTLSQPLPLRRRFYIE
ncbi:unnamed protein product [Polarella glacialis]|uniref:Uncharacterized protein n=1 Tax=Polarella glacialis TaxID=89957 RepID=A0A813LLS3_POLGL|nr:unnamed protein product [Polarella glacialis]CAE8732979.1 unnamed protein product [Polarella glacialis]